MLPWGSEIPCPEQTASGRGRPPLDSAPLAPTSPPAPLDPIPTPPGPSRRGLSAGRDLGSAASAQRPPCPGGDPRPRWGRAITLLGGCGASGHPPPPDLGPLQGPAPDFLAPRPAPRGLFGGRAARNLLGLAGRTVSAQRRGRLEGAAAHSPPVRSHPPAAAKAHSSSWTPSPPCKGRGPGFLPPPHPRHPEGRPQISPRKSLGTCESLSG